MYIYTLELISVRTIHTLASYDLFHILFNVKMGVEVIDK
mgnify:CR=1 FL=1